MLCVVTGESITFGQGGEQKGIKFRLGHGYQQMPDICRKEALYVYVTRACTRIVACACKFPSISKARFFLNHSIN